MLKGHQKISDQDAPSMTRQMWTVTTRPPPLARRQQQGRLDTNTRTLQKKKFPSWCKHEVSYLARLDVPCDFSPSAARVPLPPLQPEPATSLFTARFATGLAAAVPLLATLEQKDEAKNNHCGRGAGRWYMFQFLSFEVAVCKM